MRSFTRVTDKPAHEPKLVIEVGYSVKIEQKIDLLAFYSQLDERGQAEYLKFVTMNEQGYADSECPIAFLYPNDDQPYIASEPTSVPLPLKEGVADPEHVDIDDWAEGRVIMREGDKNWRSSEFDAGDFEYLLKRVPWMKRIHDALDEDEVDAEELARIPGPLDTPMEGI